MTTSSSPILLPILHTPASASGAPRAAGPTLPSVNPTNPAEVVAEAVTTTQEEVSEALAGAAAAQAAWAKVAGSARAEVLYRWADRILASSDELASAIVREVGKPLGEAKGEVGRCAAILRYFAGDCVRSAGEVIPALVGTHLQYSIRKPLGVVGLITPWNFPLAIPLWKAAPALAWGNAVVLKPSEASPLCASLLARTAQEAGLPDGLLTVLYGDGEVAEALMAHENCRAISFTGSARVGAIVAAQCAARNIKFQTEMGGKNPSIVLADANLKASAGLIAGAAMRYAGQKCTATSVVIVEKSAHAEFMQELIAAVAALPVGDPMDAATAIGPVISEASQQRLLKTISETPFKKAYEGTVPSTGFFVPPVIFDEVPAGSPILLQELFGPVLAIEVADSADHAIELANASPYGLSASLFTTNLSAAFEYVRRIEAGMVRVNADSTGVDPHAPFGGVKGSSSGTREQGAAAKDFYTEVQTIQINPN